jgi:hypothetical protein
LKDTSKFTQIGIFGVKIYHLATLPQLTLPKPFFSKNRRKQNFGRNWFWSDLAPGGPDNFAKKMAKIYPEPFLSILVHNLYRGKE